MFGSIAFTLYYIIVFVNFQSVIWTYFENHFFCLIYANVKTISVTLDSVVCTIRKELHLRSDGGDSGSKKSKCGCGSAYEDCGI
jgi:hypothetical protein